jgi:hypothetical protein
MRARNERHLASLLAPLHEAHGATLSARASEAAVVPPPEFTFREYSVFLLTIGAQIEHSLMVQYLYAAWSLGGSQVPEEHRDAVAAWRQIILGIAKEEMGHLVTVQNLLRFLGAPLALDREDYPWDSGLAPYPFALERLTRSTLAKYVIAESPETWPDDVSVAERQEIETLAAGTSGSHINRVGVLYKALIDLFKDARASGICLPPGNLSAAGVLGRVRPRLRQGGARVVHCRDREDAGRSCSPRCFAIGRALGSERDRRTRGGPEHARGHG